MKFAKSVFVVLGFALLSPAPFPLVPAVHAQDQLWITQFGSSEFDVPYAVAPDGAGGAIVGGYTRGNLGGTNAGSRDAFLARYDGAGSQLWIRQFGTSAIDEFHALVPDGAGGVIVAGYTFADLGGPNAGGYDAFLARYDSAGDQVWIRQFGTSASDQAFALSPDGAGGVIVAGWTQGNLGGPNAGLNDAFLARYDSAGNQLWARQFGTSSFDEVHGLAPDGAGGVLVAGFTEGSLGGPFAGGFRDAFLARYDGAGNRVWIRQFGTNERDEARAVASDGAGGAMVGGFTDGSLGGPHVAILSDAYLARYDETGTRLWIHQFGAAGAAAGVTALAPDGEGGVIVAGYISRDAFLASYNAQGDQVWFRQFGASGASDAAAALASVGPWDVMVAGSTSGSLGAPNAGRSDAFLAKYTQDMDRDGLSSQWELNGIPYYDSVTGFNLRFVLPGADPTHKDLYVEVDAMTGFSLSSAAVALLENAFFQAPVSNPDGFDGITLHVLRDVDALPHVPVWQTSGCWPLDFDAVRSRWYGTPGERGAGAAAALLAAKAKAYRYCIVADDSGPTPFGGCGQRPGDNFVIFVDGYNDEQMATAFMHELGHNLSLQHGGGDSINGKPNYPSIMNYVMAYKYNWNRAFWTLDYSRADAGNFASLNEASLNEPAGIGTPGGYYSGFKMPYGVNEMDAGGNTVRKIKYVRLDGSATDFGNTTGTQFQDGRFTIGVAQDLNYAVDPPPGISLPGVSSFPDDLDPYDDWAHVSLPLGAVLGAGAPTISYPTDELTDEARDWINANFPMPPGSCYADCDQSTGAGVLDIFDFLCFQDSFVNNEPYACDCDTSTGPLVCDLFDFLCFQDAFVGGCP